MTDTLDRFCAEYKLQQQQPQVVVEDIQREETPPPGEDEALMPPPRPQKEQGRHRVLMNFEASSTSKWPRRRSCNRIAFLQAFDSTNNPYKEETGGQVILDDNQDITISDTNEIILSHDISNKQNITRTKAKSMSTLEPTTLSKEDAEFIASTVLEVLDQKEAYKFVKNKLLQDMHISRFTKQEISINVQNVSLSTDENNTSTSTQGSSFHSASSSQSTSPVNLNIVSGEVQWKK